ncbi:MAG TPA: hypothetical protein VE344_00565, partial [Methylomirabilota bacterium]|nr:hypothetical protein [Methylomirabilota bacterium]
AWAETQGKNDIFDAVDFSAPDLLHQTEADCLTNCTAIYNAGNTNIAALTATGTLAAADLTDLNTKIGALPCSEICLSQFLPLTGSVRRKICSVNPR